MPMALPPTGEFSRLESLELVTVCNIFPALLPICPRLRRLRIWRCRELKEMTVHSTTLEELVVECYCLRTGIRRIDIDAPELKEAKLEVPTGREFDVSFSAPKLEKLVWESGNLVSEIGFPMMLGMLRYSLKDGVRTLRLDITCKKEEEDEELCPQDCPCRQPVDWKSETLSLPDLQEVLISYNFKEFKEGNEEVDFLKLLFRCARGLKCVDVGVNGEVYDEICSICRENPHVKCHVSC
ncbi:hypothetical protein EJB05_12600 [Eragrostis curvula]|uniref:FBD domain-containing protein n=1 Tax=Eragrostis curvula TaxID=38414 RepID=A0A5J9VTX0_9POAL|nr:hypothetical protein EJB05_12600 [Eragrostis curvula]